MQTQKQFEVSDQEIEDRIQMVSSLVLPNTTVTIVSLHLASGFVVNGESACVNPASFNPERGIELAKEKAKRKLRELLEFLKAEEQYEATCAHRHPGT